MIITCYLNKMLYHNEMNGYKVISCFPKNGTDYKGLELNKYGNFTISGDNLEGFNIGTEVSIDIESDKSSKYSASYVLVGFSGLTAADGEIKVEPNTEMQILCSFMQKSQAQYVNSAYPDFVSRVLNNKEDTIDYKQIYNVGEYRLNEYIKKVRENCRHILLTAVAAKYGIKSNNDIRKLAEFYAYPGLLEQSLQTQPYMVFCEQLGWKFIKADFQILVNDKSWEDSEQRCLWAVIDILQMNEDEGDTRLDRKIIYDMANEVAPESVGHFGKVLDNERIYWDESTDTLALFQTYMCEKEIAENIIERVKNPRPCPMNWQAFKNVDGMELTEEQCEILKMAGQYDVMMLTGNAGSGKTSSTRALIRMLEANNQSYTLLAPTGIAAKMLKQSTGREARTVNLFLVTHGYCGEYLILDEASMLSVHLLGSLFSYLKVEGYYPKIIFICDPAQLASVSCGNVVQNIIDSGIVPIANLTKVFRYGEGGIATTATDIRLGHDIDFSKQYVDSKFINVEDDIFDVVIDEYKSILNMGYKQNEILILSPFNKGEIGTVAINEEIQAEMNPNPYIDGIEIKRGNFTIKFKEKDLVINTKNNYKATELEIDEFGEIVPTDTPASIVNGDIGTIVKRMDSDGKAGLVIDFNGQLIWMVGPEIGNLLLGYAISCHKSQGSQAPAVILIIDSAHRSLLSRNLCYVGVSRAQKYLCVIGQERALNQALTVEENMERDTNLGDMLKL